jgi:hypothetical protein
MAGHRADGVDDLAVGESGPVAEVVEAVFAGLDRGEREQMCRGQVGDVDVVAHAGAIRGGVVVAEEGQLLPLACGHQQGIGDEMGLRVVPLTPGPTRPYQGPGGVEVAQGDRGQPVCRDVPGDRVLDGELAGGVWVRRCGDRGLGDRLLGRVSVDVRGRGEHQSRNPRRPDRVQQTQRADHVVFPVLLRGGHALAGRDVRGEMQDPVECGLRGEDVAGDVVHPAADEPGAARDRTLVPGGQVIQHHHLVPGLQ